MPPLRTVWCIMVPCLTCMFGRTIDLLMQVLVETTMLEVIIESCIRVFDMTELVFITDLRVPLFLMNPVGGHVGGPARTG